MVQNSIILANSERVSSRAAPLAVTVPGPVVEQPDGEQVNNSDDSTPPPVSLAGLSWLGVVSTFWLTQSVWVCWNTGIVTYYEGEAKGTKIY